MLNDETLRLRAIEEKDLERFRKWRNSGEIHPYVREFKPLTPLHQKQWFQSLPGSDNIMFAMQYQNTLIGCCGLTYIDWKNGNTEISIYIGFGNYKKKGLASKAVQLLLQYAFNELRLHRVYAVIFSYNKKNIKLFEQNLFGYEGKNREARFYNGKYHDELIYGVLDYEFQKSQQS